MDIFQIRKSTGRVVAHINSPGPIPEETDEFLWREAPADVPRDQPLIYQDGKFHPAEKLGTLLKVIGAAQNELRQSDWRAATDRPPMPQEWKDYREALREVIRAGVKVDSRSTFPFRPDGSDPIAHLR